MVKPRAGEPINQIQRAKPHVHVTKHDDGSVDYVCTSRYAIKNIANVRGITTPVIGLDKGFDLEIDGAGKDLHDLIEYWYQFEANWSMYHKPWHRGLEQWFANLPYAIDPSRSHRTYSLNALRDSIKGQRVLFLGAGDSLKKHSQHIKKVIADRSCVVIAGGSAIRCCAKLGITPHFCMAIDPFEPEWDTVFKDLPVEFTRQCPLIVTLRLEPRCLKKWRGPLIVNALEQSLNASKWLLEAPGCQDGHVGVSTALLELAKACGAKEVHLCGVDLAYTDKNVMYADGGGYHDTNDVVEVDGVLTRPTWQQEAMWLSRQSEELRVYRWKSHGLPIQNTKPFNPRKSKLKPQSTDPLKGLKGDNLLSHHVNADLIAVRIKLLCSQLQDIENQIRHTHDYRNTKCPGQSTEAYAMILAPWFDVALGVCIRTGLLPWPTIELTCRRAQESLQDCLAQMTMVQRQGL